MNKLIKTITQLIEIEGYDWEKLFFASKQYIETLSSSSSQEIEGMLQYIYDNYYIECPFWARLIAFRILVLQNPDNEEIKRWAKNDIIMFGGPEWKDIVKEW